MSIEDKIVLDNDFDKKVFEYALKIGKVFMRYNPDLKPTISFLFSKEDPNRVLMFPKDEDCNAFLAALDSQLHEKFIVPGAEGFSRKIYYMVFRELGLLKK
jgi:hypothetical protein